MDISSLFPSSLPETTRLSSKGDQAVSNTGAVWPLARGKISGSLVGNPEGEGLVKGEKEGRMQNAY
jgi:hypothetical protein